MGKGHKVTSADARVVKLYNEIARSWGEAYIRRHLWRIRAMYDFDDVKQDAFLIFLRTYKRYPDLKAEDLLKIYKAGIIGRIHNRARECFPNSYAYEEGIGKVVLDIDDHEPAGVAEHDLDVLYDLLMKLPSELAEVMKILIRDFVGVSCIEQRRTRKLSGGARLEPYNVALAREAGLNPSRDLFEELSNALTVKQMNEE